MAAVALSVIYLLNAVQTETFTGEPNFRSLDAVLSYAEKYAGNDKLGKKCKKGWDGGGSQGACGRCTKAIVGALTGNPRFANTWGLGGNANKYAKEGGNDFTDSGIYQVRDSSAAYQYNDFRTVYGSESE